MAKYYYNGVLLPEIPAEVLSEYPYLLVFRGASSASLWAAKSKPYFKVDGTINKIIIPDCEHCRYDLVNDGWTFKYSYTTMTWFDMASSVLGWANYNVPNGSATATAIYFYSTYPIPEADECYYNGVRLPAIPANVLASYPYCFIRYNANTGYYDLYCSNTVVFYANNLLQFGANAPERQVYRIAIANAENATEWESLGTSTANIGIDTNRTVLWANHDIPNGSATATDIYFEGSEPVPEGEQEPDVPGRTSGYIIRSGSTLYTITDGTLTALAETEITASLFLTYGVDEIPDGALLVGLTDPEVLYWHDSADELPDITITVKGTPPLPQMFTSEPMSLVHESIAGISHAAVDASEDVRFAISFDGGTTWKAFDGSAWFDTSDTVPGMLPSTMNAITAAQWAEVVVLDSYMVQFWLPNITAYVKSVVMHYINP